jgi:hypothetical protein
VAVRLKRLFGKALRFCADGLRQLVIQLVVWGAAMGFLLAFLIFMNASQLPACVSGMSWPLLMAFSFMQVLLVAAVCFFILRRFHASIFQTQERLTMLMAQQNILLERLAQTQDARGSE